MASGYWRISPEIIKEDKNYPGRYRMIPPFPIVHPDEYSVNIVTSKTVLFDVGHYVGYDQNNNQVDIWVNVPVFITVGPNSNYGIEGSFSAYVGANKPISVSSSYTTNLLIVEPYQDNDGLYYPQIYFYCYN